MACATCTIETEYEQMCQRCKTIGFIWDLYKDVNGFRPRGINFDAMSDSEIEAFAQDLVKENEDQRNGALDRAKEALKDMANLAQNVQGWTVANVIYHMAINSEVFQPHDSFVEIAIYEINQQYNIEPGWLNEKNSPQLFAALQGAFGLYLKNGYKKK